MENIIHDFCKKHNIEPQVLIDVYEERLTNALSAINNYGIYSITKEREEQISKHGRTKAKDIEQNSEGQLKLAAINLLSKSMQRESGCPKGWSQEIYNKMANKSMIDRLIIAGALIAAEIDRLNP